MTAEERKKLIQQEVWRIADKHFEAMFEDFDRLDKGRVIDATATEIIEALKAGGYSEEAEGYEDWLCEGMANERKEDGGQAGTA